jgi:hypothetical protein
MTQVDGPAVDPGLYRAEQPELRRHPTSANLHGLAPTRQAAPDQGIQDTHKEQE